MVIFCSTEWPSFNVGWPREGTFDLRTVWRVREIILRPRNGHPDQVPYILVWEDLIVSSTPWIQPFLPPQAAVDTEILVAEEKKKPPAAPSAPVLQEDSTLLDLLITPPPYSLPPPIQPKPPLPQPSPEAAGGGSAMNTRNHRAAFPGGLPTLLQQLFFISGLWVPLMLMEICPFNICPFLLVIYTIGGPRTPHFQRDLKSLLIC